MSEIHKGAIISPCGLFRYRLWRRWGGEGAPLLFVMLNPSTADGTLDDATVRRCIRFAQDHGYPAMEIVNLFAFRSSSPSELRAAGWLIGPANDAHILEAAIGAGAVCVAWGSNVAGLERPGLVLAALRKVRREIYCLHITRSGYPQHPLMLPASRRLTPFTTQAVREAMT